MDKEKYFDDILNFILEYKQIKKRSSVNEKTKLFEELSITSFDLLVILCEVEQKFSVEIPLDNEFNVITVGDLLTYIKKYATEYSSTVE